MKFQSVDIEGIVNLQRVDSLPPWNIQTDVGRVLYVRDETCFYRGTSEGWERATSNGLNPVLVIKNYTAKDQDLCLVDTRNGPITITLPPNPKMGSVIAFVDCAGTFETNYCTVAANGKRIQRLTKDLILDINDFAGYIVYDPLTSSWKASIEGVVQLVGNSTVFVHKSTLIADNIDGTGGQRQFTFPWSYNPYHDNISVSIQGVQQYHFEKTNQNSITLAESVPAGTEVQICSIPLEGSFDIEQLVTWKLLERDYVKASDLLEWIRKHDGHGSGIDADMLDGYEGNKYLLIENLLKELLKVDGENSGLDADKLDGLETSQVGPMPNVIPVTGPNGTLDRRFLPFGRGGLELVQVFDIPEGASAIDITNLDTDTGYLIKGFNISPTTEDVRLSLGVYNETEKAWAQGFAYWTCTYTTATSSGLRDFNSDSDMTLAKHVKSVNGGVNLEIWVDGFYGQTDPNVKNRTKTVKTTVHFLGSGAECASLYESVGTLPKFYNVYSAIRLYFAPEGSTNVSLIAEGGKICVYRWVGELEGFSLDPNLSAYKIIIKEGTQNVQELEQNIRAITTHYPEATVKCASINIAELEYLLGTDRNRKYPDFEIRDTHYTVGDFYGSQLPRDLKLEIGQMNLTDVADNLHTRELHYDDVSVKPSAYTVEDLEDALQNNRTTSDIPEFDIYDGHYTVGDFGESTSRFKVVNGQLTVGDVEKNENSEDVDFEDVSLRPTSYNVNSLSNMLENENKEPLQLPEVTVINNSASTETLEKE